MITIVLPLYFCDVFISFERNHLDLLFFDCLCGVNIFFIAGLKTVGCYMSVCRLRLAENTRTSTNHRLHATPAGGSVRRDVSERAGLRENSDDGDYTAVWWRWFF